MKVVPNDSYKKICHLNMQFSFICMEFKKCTQFNKKCIHTKHLNKKSIHTHTLNTEDMEDI